MPDFSARFLVLGGGLFLFFHRFAVRVPPPLGAGMNHSFLFFHITRNVVLLEI